MKHREQILESVARTLFVCAYADHCDECENDECSVCGESGKASGGEDWMDVAPDTSPEATALAEDLVMKFERSNNRSVETMYARAATLPGKHYEDPTLDEFGYCLAMEALGHGVGWADNHPNHGYTVPRIEGLYLESES